MSLTQIFKGSLVFFAALGVVYLAYATLDILIALLVAIIVASAVRPVILRLVKWGLPQALAVLVVYLGIATVVIGLLVIVMPPVINQFVSYIQNDNRLANQIIAAQAWMERTVSQFMGSDFDLGFAPEDIRTSVSELVDTARITAPTLIGDAASFLGEFLLLIVMGLYWITARERAENFLVELAPIPRRPQIRAIIDEIELGLGAYVRGIVIISFIVGILSFIIFALLRIPGAASLSFFYAVATAIPIVGGLIGVGLATFLAALTSPLNAVIVLVVTVLIQQVENYYLTPRVMAKGTDFDPLLIIVFAAAGFTLNGIMGALIAIPIAGTVAILLKHLVIEPHKATVASTRMQSDILLPSAENKEP